MPRWIQILLHVVSVGAGAYLSYTTGTPLPAVISTGASGLIGSMAQSYNTDGPPQSTPYPPPTVSPSALAEQDAWTKIRAAGGSK